MLTKSIKLAIRGSSAIRAITFKVCVPTALLSGLTVYSLQCGYYTLSFVHKMFINLSMYTVDVVRAVSLGKLFAISPAST